MNNDPDLTFDIRSCRDLCLKLDREFGRLQADTDREHHTDHALNFAFTAWHLIDWIWEARERGILEFRRELAEAAKQWPPGRQGFAIFREYVCAMCPQLRYCEMIAISTKHLAVDSRKGRPDIETAVSFGPTMTAMPVLKIVDGDKRYDTVQIFDGILDFWSSFVHGQTTER